MGLPHIEDDEGVPTTPEESAEVAIGAKGGGGERLPDGDTSGNGPAGLAGRTGGPAGSADTGCGHRWRSMDSFLNPDQSK